MNTVSKFRGQTRRRGEKVRMDRTAVASNWVYGGIFPGKYAFQLSIHMNQLQNSPYTLIL